MTTPTEPDAEPVTVTETPETHADGAGSGDTAHAAAILADAGACDEGQRWAASTAADPQTAWAACKRGHWCLWWVGRCVAATDGPGLGERLTLVRGLGDIAAMVAGSGAVAVLHDPISPTLLMRACRLAADQIAADLGEQDAAGMVRQFTGVSLADAEMPTDLALDALRLCVYGAMGATAADLPEVASGVAVFSGMLFPAGDARRRWLATVADVARVRWPEAGEWRPET